MPEAGQHIIEDIRAMLAKATPEQVERLLWDILTTPPAKDEGVCYDA